jgi:hypothetical protein
VAFKKLYDAKHSAWAARIIHEISHVADGAIHGEERKKFDAKHIALFKVMQECFDALLALQSFIVDYENEVRAGTGRVQVKQGQIIIDGDPDVTLNRLFKDFITKARTVLYHLFGITKFLGYDLGFFQIKDDAKFEERAEGFHQKVPGRRGEIILELLRADRKAWSKMLIELRNIVIHKTECPALRIVHWIDDGSVRVKFCTVQGVEIREFGQLIWKNLFEFVEDLLILVLALQLSPLLVVYQTPPSQRVANDPAKYKVVVRPSDVPKDELVIQFHHPLIP